MQNMPLFKVWSADKVKKFIVAENFGIDRYINNQAKTLSLPGNQDLILYEGDWTC